MLKADEKRNVVSTNFPEGLNVYLGHTCKRGTMTQTWFRQQVRLHVQRWITYWDRGRQQLAYRSIRNLKIFTST